MRFKHLKGILALVTIVASGTIGHARQITQQQPVPVAVEKPALTGLPDYVLGPGDMIVISAINLDEIANKPVRITAAGDINLPLVGQVHAMGMTTQELQTVLVERLKGYVRIPELAVNVTDFRSHPVSVLGAIRSPGLIQLDGHRTLIEVLSMAGGLRDDASYRIKITRKSEWGRIPLDTATDEPDGAHTTAEVNYMSIIDAAKPEDNIQIFPYDIVSVSRAKVVYVVGAMMKPGEYVMNEKEQISLLELLARADGWTPTAKPQDAKILRRKPGETHDEIAVNLRNLLDRKVTDTTLLADDILVVPDSYAKSQIRSTLGYAIQAITGLAIYRPY